MNSLLHAIALLLDTSIGFSAHRARLCTVRAVAEPLSSCQGYVLASFAKASAWINMIYGKLLLLLLPTSAATAFPFYEPRLLTLSGKFLFGVDSGLPKAVCGCC